MKLLLSMKTLQALLVMAGHTKNTYTEYRCAKNQYHGKILWSKIVYCVLSTDSGKNNIKILV